MTTISGTNTTALAILQQTQSLVATREGTPSSASLVAVANGLNEKIGLSPQPGRAESQISESIFSVNAVDINKLKLNLIDRAADALGFDENDFASRDDFVSAMMDQLYKMSGTEGGKDKIVAIEKDLGLDKLGVSLMDVVRSAADPEAEDKVSAALREQEDEDDEASQPEGVDAPGSLAVQSDELGIYNPSKV